MKNVKKLVFLALLVALEIVLTRFLSITTPIVRIGFGFLPVALAGIFFGPVYGVLAGTISDLMGFFLFPVGTYFPGFTFSAALRGFIFGMVHYPGRVDFKRTLISVIATNVIIDLFINSIWLHILYGNAYSAMVIPRLIRAGFMIPISTMLILGSWNAIKGFFGKKLIDMTR